jgi:hypothetical protein
VFKELRDGTNGFNRMLKILLQKKKKIECSRLENESFHLYPVFYVGEVDHCMKEYEEK